MLIENIGRDLNRASIIIWSVGNETLVHNDRIVFMKNIARKARQPDPTRLISAAMEVHVTPDAPPYIYRVDDLRGEYFDVIACNEYVG